MTESSTDNRQQRGEATRHAMMRAAEKLIAENGIENVSIRDIVQGAGQKNESALQYHFGNLNGLLTALKISRSKEVQRKRQQQMDILLAENPKPAFRDICRLMITPSFELARSDPGFKRYIISFSHDLSAADEPYLQVSKTEAAAEPGLLLGNMLRAAMTGLSEQEFRRRMDFAIRLCSSAMHNHARQKGAFKGKKAELFLESLVDALVGLLSAPVSEETRRLQG